MKQTVRGIRQKKKKEKITVLTGYDFLFAGILDRAGLDIILVGDSLGMVVLGHESTLPVTMRDMVHHTRAVSRAAKHSLVVSDMPFGSYDAPEKAVRNAARLMKQAGADAVKVEGGTRIRKQVSALIAADIPVMGHVGLTPQSASQLGGYRVQGRVRKEAEAIYKDALLLDRLGVFSMVLECVPAALAGKISRAVSCPTIGIGAGPKTDGQVLVISDLLGFESTVKPRFVRSYARLDQTVTKAVKQFQEDVCRGNYPSKEESY